MTIDCDGRFDATLDPWENPNMLVRRVSTAAVLGASLMAAAGCYFPGGPGYSADRFTYESHSWQPWTVTLVDTRTGQTIWSVDVPVGEQLVVDFDEGKGMKDSPTPDLMYWEIMPMGQRFGPLDNRLAVPPASARLLQPTLRATPELPDDMDAAPPPKAPVIVEPGTTPRPASDTPPSSPGGPTPK